MKKLWSEFKKFISRGNVIDLAVGMIIGAAFTAIITAIVTGVLKPLINLIPIGKTGLQTVLRHAVVDEEGHVVTEALILDWGGVISAIITFLLTAIVLFIIIKAINKARSGLGNVKKGYKVLEKSEVKALRRQGKTKEEIRAIDEERAAAKAAEEARAAEEAANQHTLTEEVLLEIRELLRAQQTTSTPSGDARAAAPSEDR